MANLTLLLLRLDDLLDQMNGFKDHLPFFRVSNVSSAERRAAIRALENAEKSYNIELDIMSQRALVSTLGLSNAARDVFARIRNHEVAERIKQLASRPDQLRLENEVSFTTSDDIVF